MTLIEAARKALEALIRLGEHAGKCGVTDLDENGRHCECTCGYQSAITNLSTAISEAEKQEELIKANEGNTVTMTRKQFEAWCDQPY